jgi:putative nucleotidyltransferase with HDIG domain
MNEAIQFLSALAQAVSAMSLYTEGHPARDRALDLTFDRLQALQAVKPTAVFTFLGDEIVLDQRPLRELKSWAWGSRFSNGGIQRVELTGRVERPDLELFLEDVYQRLTGTPVNTAEARPTRPTNIRFGTLGLLGESGSGTGADEIVTAPLGFTLAEEVQAVDWLHDELRDNKQLHLLEAESIVRSLSVAMHGDQAFVIPLLKLKRYDQYTTTHAMNVSVLAMALAEHIGLSPSEVRAFGISGLLHDLGKVVIPEEILNKPGKLTHEERAIMNRHPADGARLILETESQLDLAATVAYEHHIRLNGAGYPTLAYPRRCHQASDMVHVCDVFDALRTNRPYREAWGTDRVLAYVEEGAGSEFDPDLARAFVQMIRTWESKVLYLAREDEPVTPAAAPGETPALASAPPPSARAVDPSVPGAPGAPPIPPGGADRASIDVVAIDLDDDEELDAASLAAEIEDEEE